MPSIQTIGGVPVNAPGSPSVAIVRPDGARSVSVSVASRQGTHALRAGSTHNPRTLPFEAWCPPGMTVAAFQAAVEAILAPEHGPRELAALRDDGVTGVRLVVDVLSLEKSAETGALYTGAFQALDRTWRGDAIVGATGGSVVVPGELTTQPLIWLTPVALAGRVTACQMIAVDVTDRTGRGLDGWPVRMGESLAEAGGLDMSGMGALTVNNVIAFAQSRAVPFYVQGQGTANAKLDARLNVEAAGTRRVSVFFGPSIANTVTAQALDDGGLDLAATAYDNEHWRWRTTTVVPPPAPPFFPAPQFSMFELSRTPRAAGAWALGRFARTIPGTTWGYVDAAAAAEFNVVTEAAATGIAYNEDADGMSLITQVEVAAGAVIRGFDVAIVSGFDGTARTSYVRPLDTTYQAMTGTPAAGLVAPGATVLFFFLDGPIISQGRLRVTTNGADLPPRVDLDATKTPLVTVGAPVAAWHIADAELTNTTTGDRITLHDVYVRAGDLRIDTDRGEVSVYDPADPLTPGEVFEGQPDGGIHIGNTGRWWPLVAGTNTWESDEFTVALDFEPRYGS